MESGIPLTFWIQNPSSTDKYLNPESTEWDPESLIPLHWASLSCLRKHEVIRSERHKEHKLLCKNYKFFYLFSVNNLQCVVMHSKLPVNAVSARWVDGAVMETKMTNACFTMNKRKRMRWSNWLKNKQKEKFNIPSISFWPTFCYTAQ